MDLVERVISRLRRPLKTWLSDFKTLWPEPGEPGLRQLIGELAEQSSDLQWVVDQTRARAGEMSLARHRDEVSSQCSAEQPSLLPEASGINPLSDTRLKDVTQEVQDSQEVQDLRKPKKCKEKHEAQGSAKVLLDCAAAQRAEGDWEMFCEYLDGKHDATLSLDRHARCCYRHWRSADPAPYRSPLWEFIYWLRGHPELYGKKAKQAMIELGRLMTKWPPKQRDGDPWKALLDMPRADAEAEFISAWDAIRCPPGHSPLENALAKARAKPLKLPTSVANERPDAYPAFVSLAGWLQVVNGNQNILLPCGGVGQLLGVSPITISRYCNFALLDGYVSVEIEYPRGVRRAREYRFNVGKFEVLAQQMGRAVEEAADDGPLVYEDEAEIPF